MKELEERKQTLNDKIVIAQYGESQRLMKQEIVEYLTHSLRQESRFLLHILVKSIIVYDDKIEIYFNFTERKNPDDSDDTDSRDNNYVNCSDILPMCPPRKRQVSPVFFTWWRLLGGCTRHSRKTKLITESKVPSFTFATANLAVGLPLAGNGKLPSHYNNLQGRFHLSFLRGGGYRGVVRGTAARRSLLRNRKCRRSHSR